jgi:heat-inducible transcriptional repressor
LVEWKTEVEADQLTHLSNALNAVLGGKVMEDIAPAAIDRVCDSVAVAAEIRRALQTTFRKARRTDPQISAAGAQNLLDQPEFHDLRKLRSILRIVEEQKVLYDLIADDLAKPTTTPMVRIGAELGADEMAECSVVTMPYRFGDRGVGLLAILGPRRMPYGRLMSLAAGTAQSLGTYLDNVEIR